MPGPQAGGMFFVGSLTLIQYVYSHALYLEAGSSVCIENMLYYGDNGTHLKFSHRNYIREKCMSVGRAICHIQHILSFPWQKLSNY
jgi:hypothetical protein